MSLHLLLRPLLWLMSRFRFLEIVNLNFFRVFRVIPQTENRFPTYDDFIGKKTIFLLLIGLFIFERLAALFVSDFCHVYNMALRPTVKVSQVINFLKCCFYHS